MVNVHFQEEIKIFSLVIYLLHEKTAKKPKVAVIIVAAPNPFAQFIVAEIEQPSVICGNIKGCVENTARY